MSLAGVSERMDEVLEEIPRVRADLGYPIMVTPLSQIVGTQAAVNVIVGERYSQVIDAAVEYALGRHGNEAPSVMDQDVRDKILSSSRAKEIEALEPWEPTLAELRLKYGSDISDEDLILCAIVGDDALDVVGRSADIEPVKLAKTDLSEFVKNRLAGDGSRFVSFRGSEVSLTVVRRASGS